MSGDPAFKGNEAILKEWLGNMDWTPGKEESNNNNIPSK